MSEYGRHKISVGIYRFTITSKTVSFALQRLLKLGSVRLFVFIFEGIF